MATFNASQIAAYPTVPFGTFAAAYPAFHVRSPAEQTAPRDSIPPTVIVVSPAEGSTSRYSTLVLEVTDDTSLAALTVFASWAGLRKPDLVYRAGAFHADYTIASYVEAITGGHRLHIMRDAGWPAGQVSLLFDVVDAGGNEA